MQIDAVILDELGYLPFHNAAVDRLNWPSRIQNQTSSEKIEGIIEHGGASFQVRCSLSGDRFKEIGFEGPQDFCQLGDASGARNVFSLEQD